MVLSKSALSAQPLRYAQKIILGGSVDSDINYMHPKGISYGAPVVFFFTCLGVYAYLILNKKPHLWTNTNPHI